MDKSLIAQGLAFSPRPLVSVEERAQAARQLRDRLSCVPFYAKRAAAEKERSGDEMVYWLELQGSQVIAHRPFNGSSTADPMAGE
jgi:hypothetical protein